MAKMGPTITELTNQARKKGVKIYALVQLTSDDVICVEVKKVSFLEQISEWNDSDLIHSEIEARILRDGDILI